MKWGDGGSRKFYFKSWYRFEWNIFHLLSNVHDAREGGNFPSSRCQLGYNCVHTQHWAPQHRDVMAEKIGKKCRWSCYSSAAVHCTTLYTGAVWVSLCLYFTVSTGGPVPSLPSKPKVLEMYFVLVVQCSGCLLPHNGCSPCPWGRSTLAKRQFDYALK